MIIPKSNTNKSYIALAVLACILLYLWIADSNTLLQKNRDIVDLVVSYDKKIATLNEELRQRDDLILYQANMMPDEKSIEDQVWKRIGDIQMPLIVAWAICNPNFKIVIPWGRSFGSWLNQARDTGKVQIDKYCEKYQSYFRNAPNKNSFFLDIGANIGASGLPVAAMGYRVIGFEPVKLNALQLNYSININNFSHLYKLVYAAASSVNGKSVIYVPENAGDNASLDIKAAETVYGNSKPEEIDLITIDTFFDQNKQYDPNDCHFMKVDVQGFEYLVFMGAQLFLKTHQSLLIEAEHNPKMIQRAGLNETAALDLMYELGYDIVHGGIILTPDKFKGLPSTDIQYKKRK